MPLFPLIPEYIDTMYVVFYGFKGLICFSDEENRSKKRMFIGVVISFFLFLY
jgi:hypothetical protein|tara:strand:- start:5213 stop:5368 length:156 start_codon:yes stop_codon:yes gene_type:complete